MLTIRQWLHTMESESLGTAPDYDVAVEEANALRGVLALQAAEHKQRGQAKGCLLYTSRCV